MRRLHTRNRGSWTHVSPAEPFLKTILRVSQVGIGIEHIKHLFRIHSLAQDGLRFGLFLNAQTNKWVQRRHPADWVRLQNGCALPRQLLKVLQRETRQDLSTKALLQMQPFKDNSRRNKPCPGWERRGRGAPLCPWAGPQLCEEDGHTECPTAETLPGQIFWDLLERAETMQTARAANTHHKFNRTQLARWSYKFKWEEKRQTHLQHVFVDFHSLCRQGTAELLSLFGQLSIWRKR